MYGFKDNRFLLGSTPVQSDTEKEADIVINQTHTSEFNTQSRTQKVILLNVQKMVQCGYMNV